ncbi:MAG: HPr(Ser) kinase/phosphatase [Oscillospiraceae bacterium]|jgi:HPr kinase/phosphorylase|nr:HPr(Ser) kinase/phosphatase [Oscillospiraceae bacterium]
MPESYMVSLEKLVRDNGYNLVYAPANPETISIVSKEVSRPGLALAGFTEHFDASRVQFFGYVEMDYLANLPGDERGWRLEQFLALKPCAILLTRGQALPDEMLRLAQTYQVSVMCTEISTSDSMAALISYLGVELAERVTRHGVLVEVYGQGVLILGSSGVGKSETAVELIKRGHRLVADDAVEIRRVSNKTLVGSAPDNIRHFIELRGVGIINARSLFGMGSVKQTEKIDLVINLEPWNQEKVYDRLGLDEEFTTILDIPVPVCVVPVKPGRNLSIIVEIAAMNHRQKAMGYNAARELLADLGMEIDTPTRRELDVWNH